VEEDFFGRFHPREHLLVAAARARHSDPGFAVQLADDLPGSGVRLEGYHVAGVQAGQLGQVRKSCGVLVGTLGWGTSLGYHQPCNTTSFIISSIYTNLINLCTIKQLLMLTVHSLITTLNEASQDRGKI